MPASTPRKFLATLLAETRAAWRTLRAAHPGEHFYSFGIYTSELAEYLNVTASTDEGLAQVTARHLAERGGDAARTRATLRWSPCDSPLHAEGDLLPMSQELRDALPDPYDGTLEAEGAVQFVFAAAMDVLRRLDREREFGDGNDRERIVLSAWKGDQSNEERIKWVRALNPPTVAQRFERELDAEGS